MSPPSNGTGPESRFQKSLDVNARGNNFKDSLGDNPLNVIFGNNHNVEEEKTNSSNLNAKIRIADITTPSRHEAVAGLVGSPLQSQSQAAMINDLGNGNIIVDGDFSPKVSPMHRPQPGQPAGVGIDVSQLQISDILGSRQGSHMQHI